MYTITAQEIWDMVKKVSYDKANMAQDYVLQKEIHDFNLERKLFNLYARALWGMFDEKLQYRPTTYEISKQQFEKVSFQVPY